MDKIIKCLFCGSLNCEDLNLNIEDEEPIFRCQQKECLAKYEVDMYYSNNKIFKIAFFYDLSSFDKNYSQRVFRVNNSYLEFSGNDGLTKLPLETKFDNFNFNEFLSNINNTLQEYYLFK